MLIAKGRFARGEKAGNAKLTTVQVVRIKKLKGKLSYSQIAELFGICVGVAWRIANHKSWRHVNVNAA